MTTKAELSNMEQVDFTVISRHTFKDEKKIRKDTVFKMVCSGKIAKYLLLKVAFPFC